MPRPRPDGAGGAIADAVGGASLARRISLAPHRHR